MVPGCRAGVCPEGRQATAETRSRVDTASAYRVLCSCSLRKGQQSKAMQHKAGHTEACCTLAMVQQVTATAFDGAAQALQTDRCQHACAYLFNRHLVSSSICGKGIQLLLLLCNLLCLSLLARLLCTAAGAEQVCRPCEALNQEHECPSDGKAAEHTFSHCLPLFGGCLRNSPWMSWGVCTVPAVPEFLDPGIAIR